MKIKGNQVKKVQVLDSPYFHGFEDLADAPDDTIDRLEAELQDVAVLRPVDGVEPPVDEEDPPIMEDATDHSMPFASPPLPSSSRPLPSSSRPTCSMI